MPNLSPPSANIDEILSDMIGRGVDCCDGPDQPIASPPRRRRARMWELADYLHCSIIGTCLSTSELRRILQKLNVEGAASASEHKLHNMGVSLSGRKDQTSKMLYKALDRRHGVAIKQFARARSASEVLALWNAAVERGDIPGAYWAALTHPEANHEVVSQVFSEVHMLSHLVGAANRADIRRLRRLEAEKSDLEAKVIRQERQLRDTLKARDETIYSLRQTLARVLTEQHRTARHATAGLDARDHDGLTALVADRERRLEVEQRRRVRLEDKLRRAETALAEEAARRTAAEQSVATLTEELDSTERAAWSTIGEPEDGPRALPNAAGRTFLYVGGHTHHIPKFRLAVERCGGSLLHHDGGLEEDQGLLPGLVSKADVVLFPVDCVSHKAVAIIKRHCKTAGKPYLPLRSAGLSSFLAALSSNRLWRPLGTAAE